MLLSSTVQPLLWLRSQLIREKEPGELVAWVEGVNVRPLRLTLQCSALSPCAEHDQHAPQTRAESLRVARDDYVEQRTQLCCCWQS